MKIAFYSHSMCRISSLKYDQTVIWLQFRAVAFPNQYRTELFCLQMPFKYFKKTKTYFNLKSIKSPRRDEWMGLAVSWNVGHSPENVHALVNSKLSHNLESSPIICTMESSRIKFLRYSIFESTILIFIKDAWAVSTEQGNFSFRLTKVPKLLGPRNLFVLCCHPPWLGFTLSNTKYIFALRFANSNSNFQFLGLEQEKASVFAQPSTLTYVDMLVFENWCTSLSNYVLAHLE